MICCYRRGRRRRGKRSRLIGNDDGEEEGPGREGKRQVRW